MCAPMLPWVARMQKPALLHSFFLPFLFLSGFLLFKDSPLHLQLCLLFLWMALCVGCCLLLGFLPSCPAHNGPGAPLCLPPAPHCPWIPRGLCRKFPVFTPARTSSGMRSPGLSFGRPLLPLQQCVPTKRGPLDCYKWSLHLILKWKRSYSFLPELKVK